VGLISDFPNQKTAWSGDDKDLVRWGHLSPYETRNTFAFMVSRRQADGLRERLARGEKVVMKAHVRARMVPAAYDVVTATIPGASKEEVLLTAHLCHESAGANDNASGSAAILEVARALHSAIADGTLKAPRRTIRFLWLPEIAGSEAYLVSHPEIVKEGVAGIHMDMVGGLLGTTHGTFHLSMSAESHPHVVNEIARAFFEDVVSRSAALAERGGDPYAGLVWAPGSRDAFLGDIRKLELGSDHEVFEEASFGIPMVYFHDWPDVTIHTNKDQPENLDATKLGRVAYLGAGIAWTLAALPDEEAPKLLAVAREGGEERIARGRLVAELSGQDRDGSLALREAIAATVETLDTLGTLFPALSGSVHEGRAALQRQMPPVPVLSTGDRRVPVRDPGVRGPLDVYYYDHLQEVLGPGAETRAGLSAREGGDVLAYEALNLVDGHRTISEIRDTITGRYEPVSEKDVAAYLELLASAKVIHFKD
jgi:aminopeptidase YwaD